MIDGVLRRTSVSALQLADASTAEGCYRKWHFQYVLGFKEPETPAQLVGKEHHAQIAHYLETGEKRLPDRILRNLHFVPPPGPDLLVEHPLIPVMLDGSSGLRLAPVRAAGVPLVGYIDVINPRETNAGCGDIQDTHDPKNTIEVIDWKFAGSMDYAKTGPKLLKTIQMPGYGKYVFARWPEVEFVRLSHGYMPARGRGEKRTARFDRAAIEKSWEHAEGVARSLVDVAREVNPEKIPANIRACFAFRKRCMHAAQGRCTAGMRNSLRAIVSAKISVEAKDQPFMSSPLSLIDRLRGVAPAVATDPAIAQAAEMARLQAEEIEMRAARAVDSAITAITAYGMGVPVVSVELRTLLAKARPGINPDTYTGVGALGTPPPGQEALVITDVKTLGELLEALEQSKQAELAAAVGAPPPTVTAPPAPPPTRTQTPAAVLPPEAPIPETPVASATAQVPTVPINQSKPADAPKKRGRPPKVRAPEVTVGLNGSSETSTDGETLHLLVDVIADGVEAMSLHPYIDKWCSELCGSDLADIRIAPPEHALGYGKWPGALAAYAREQADTMPGGYYTVSSAGGQLTEVVIEAMRAIVRARGGTVIRGVK